MTGETHILQRLDEFRSEIVVRENEVLSKHTRFGLGGAARWMVDVRASAVLPSVVAILRESSLPLITLGGGSNLIVADSGFDGVVLRFTGSSILRKDGLTVAEAGAVWQDVVDFHTDLGLIGMERMTGIPGWLGGALYGNAGAYGQTMMDFAEQVKVLFGSHPYGAFGAIVAVIFMTIVLWPKVAATLAKGVSEHQTAPLLPLARC